jgi:hypothetical protein
LIPLFFLASLPVFGDDRVVEIRNVGADYAAHRYF